jgi:hypothetical protein
LHGNCKYCGMSDSDHESLQCPDIRVHEHHRCHNCKEKPGYKTHNAGEKVKCEFYLDYYFARCKALKIEPEEKYKEAQVRIKQRDSGKINGKISGDMDSINRKFAQQTVLNKKLFGENIANYTAVCESFLDGSIMEAYKVIRVDEVTEEELD